MKNYRFIFTLLITLLSINTWSQTSNQGSRTTTVEFDFRGEDCLRRGRDLCSSKIVDDFPANLIMKSSNSGFNSFKLLLYSNKFSETDQTEIAGKAFESFKINEVASFRQNYDLILNETVLNILELDVEYNVIKKGS